MFAFVLRLVATSPSFEYKTIKSRMLKEPSHHIYQKLMQIAKSHWKVLCLLSIKLKKRTLHSLQQRCSPSVLYMMIVFFLTCEAFEWLHHSASAAVYVQIMNVTLRHFIEVSVLSQKRVNDHVCPCCAYRFCLHFYVFPIEVWSCPDGVSLICFSIFPG